MGLRSTNSFTSYDLTDSEVLQGSILNDLQIQVIQNEMAQVAEQILQLAYDPLNPQKFVQDDSFLKGQLSVLRVMLMRSSESKEAIIRLAQQSQN
jgi:hypothetical protein